MPIDAMKAALPELVEVLLDDLLGAGVHRREGGVLASRPQSKAVSWSRPPGAASALISGCSTDALQLQAVEPTAEIVPRHLHESRIDDASDARDRKNYRTEGYPYQMFSSPGHFSSTRTGVHVR